MLDNSIPRRYAKAFYDIAKEQQDLDRFEQEFTKVIDIVNSSTELSAFINNQQISAVQKKNVIEEIFSNEVSPITVDFLKVVMDKRREYSLHQIYIAFEEIIKLDKNIMDAEVISATELNEEDVQTIVAKLTEATDKKINLKTTVDPSIKGGLIVKFGDKVIDGSITKRLELLKRRLVNAANV